MRSRSSPRAVNIRTGVRRSARIRRRTSNPSIPGSITSRTISAWSPERARSTPCALVRTVSTRKPSALRNRPTSLQSSGSSSITRTCPASDSTVWFVTLLMVRLRRGQETGAEPHSRPTTSALPSRNVKYPLTVLEGPLTKPDRAQICFMGTFACTLLPKLLTGSFTRKGQEEISHMHMNGKTVRFQPALITATREQLRLYQEFRENELDLNMARKVQQQLLQREGREVLGVDVATVCVPARELGGDFYDLLPYGSGRVALALGDVSGKGTAAALIAA